MADFSAETLEARREWHNIFKVRKGKKNTLPGKSSFSARRGGTPDARKFKEETQNGEGEAGGHSDRKSVV